MRERCLTPTYHSYSRYGGRGITICNEWESYVEFKNWALANGYKDTLTLDRIDNDGNYSFDNCRWSTPQEQAQNTSANVLEANDIPIIRIMRNEGMTHQAIANTFEVGFWVIRSVLAGATWRNC